MRGTVGAAVLLLALLAGCTTTPDQPAGSDRPEADPTPAVASEEEVAALLQRRSRALTSGRRQAFLATTAPGAGRRGQLEVFEALAALPVRTASYVVSSVDRPDGSDATRVGVLLSVRLAGIDPRPVAATHVLDLVRAGSGWRVRRDRLAPSELIASPWELPDVRVRRADGVALLADGRSAADGDRVLRLLAEARTATRSYVPYPYPLDVLVLAPSTVRPLRDAGLQPFEIQRTGAIVQGVADRRGEQVVDRMVLVPQSLRQDDDRLRNVIRHELAHMAIGQRDAGMPLWIVEGLAEWASWRGDVSFRIATTAVEAARGGITRMPPDLDFRSPENGTAYGIAWFAMKWLEQEHGAEAPYALLDALRKEGAGDDRAVSRVLERRYGLTSDELAARAGDLIASTFG